MLITLLLLSYYFYTYFIGPLQQFVLFDFNFLLFCNYRQQTITGIVSVLRTRCEKMMIVH